MQRFVILSIIKMSFGVILISFSMNLCGQANRPAQMPQYVFPEFSNARVKFKGGQVLNSMMNYNMISERMVYIKDSRYFDLGNAEMVDTVYLNLREFVPFGKTFFETLQSIPVALFVQYKGELVEAGKQVGYGGTSKTASSSYLSTINQESISYNLPIQYDYTVSVSTIYWIRIGNKMFDFQTEKQFLKLYPDKSNLIKAYMKKNHLKIESQEDLIQIVNFCSSL